MAKHFIFVYGTLMCPYWNHRLISRSEHSKFIGEATTIEPYTFASHGVPVMMRNSMHDYSYPVSGEVWEITEEDGTLASLDRLEGHPHVYQREPLVVNLNNGERELEVEGYFYQGHAEPHPPSEDGTHRFTR